MPVGVAKKLESIRARFFWDGGDDVKKLAWVKCDSVMAFYENEGLDIGSFVGFNLALLLKWRWRFVNNENMFWVRVIKNIYGSHGGFDLSHSWASGSQPWARMVAACSRLDERGVIQSNTLQNKVGNGENTTFWEDCWICGNVLATLYPRLYALDLSKYCVIADRWAHGQWVWNWRRPIRGGVEHTQLLALMDKYPLIYVRLRIDGDGISTRKEFSW